MATIETLKKRIANRTKEIEKLEKKLERINKAKSTNWEVNPYDYSDYDLRYTLSDLEEAKSRLEEYKIQLQTEEEKAASRDVKIIVDFLNEWVEESIDFYESSLPRYVEALEQRYAENHEYVDWYNRSWDERKTEEGKKRAAEERDSQNKFESTWNWFTPYVNYKRELDLEKLNRDLRQEADRKYDFIIERTNHLVGTILDASNLYVRNGELNGYLIGDRGNCEVKTIGAGGYNIQRYHFRTLIKRMK